LESVIDFWVAILEDVLEVSRGINTDIQHQFSAQFLYAEGIKEPTKGDRDRGSIIVVPSLKVLWRHPFPPVVLGKLNAESDVKDKLPPPANDYSCKLG
jgi:hypothetical protein